MYTIIVSKLGPKTAPRRLIQCSFNNEYKTIHNMERKKY